MKKETKKKRGYSRAGRKQRREQEHRQKNKIIKQTVTLNKNNKLKLVRNQKVECLLN